jgi:hypothetical protein
VAERQRPPGLEDPRGRQQFGCLGCFGLVEGRESRRVEKIALLEDSHRPRDPPGVVRQSTEPEVNRAADRPRPDPLDVVRSLFGRSDPSLAQRLHELAQQERHPSCRLQAGLDEGRIRNSTEPRLH